MPRQPQAGKAVPASESATYWMHPVVKAKFDSDGLAVSSQTLLSRSDMSLLRTHPFL
jgi:hypothetical protein